MPGLILAPLALAAEDSRHLSTTIAYGRESMSAPLLRLAPDGALVFVDGLSKLSGNSYRVSAGGMRDWAVPGDNRLAASTNLLWKHSPDTRDLGFGIVSADLMLRLPVAQAVIGIGPSLQRLWVAGARFRDTAGIQADLTMPRADGHWVFFGEAGRNGHVGDNRDLDSRVSRLAAVRRLERPFGGLDSLEFEVGWLREGNTRDLDDLSSVSRHLRVTATSTLAGIEFSASLTALRSRFAAATFPGTPPRRDAYRALDLSAAKELEKGLSLKLEINLADNLANVNFYDNRYRQVALGLERAW